MKKLGSLIISLGLALCFAGCSDPEPVDQTVNGELTDSDPRVPDDNSPYDEFTFDAGEGWTITGDLQSTAFDAYVWLIGPDGSSLVQDDDGGEGTNSRFSYTTTASGTYTIRANSFDGAGRGAYTLHYTANAGN
ncbi:MAG: PPC domain-containing protein [Sandaracinaceae bacterium]